MSNRQIAGGYAGKILYVDLSDGTVEKAPLAGDQLLNPFGLPPGQVDPLHHSAQYSLGRFGNGPPGPLPFLSPFPLRLLRHRVDHNGGHQHCVGQQLPVPTVQRPQVGP